MAFVPKAHAMGNLKYELKRVKEHEQCSHHLKKAIDEFERVLMNEYASTADNSLAEPSIINQREDNDR